MCGIAGIISSDPGEVSRERLHSMTEKLVHRGREGEGFWIDERGVAGFGHRRLAILDLSSGGAQPMHYLDRYTITYNGEIYNYIELRNNLLKAGYVFSSESDTEVILAAFDCYGTTCLQYFDGMFAFAIWDRLEKRLFCARDRFGEKPFYYVSAANLFVFASEMKGLWAAGIEKQMDDGMLLNYLGAGLVTDASNASRTFYREIVALPPASFIELDFNESTSGTSLSLRSQLYWKLDKEATAAITPGDARDTFLKLFDVSIRRRLRSDVQSGTSLSGGLDSSSIVAIIETGHKTSANYSHSAFSAVFPGFEKDESGYIDEVVRKFNLHAFSTQPTADTFISDFEKLVYHQEEPFQSSSIYAQYKVYELAAAHGVTVLLDGQGADEILGGYHRYYQWYWQELFARRAGMQLINEIRKARRLGVKTPFGAGNYLAALLPETAARQLQRRAVKFSGGELDPDFIHDNLRSSAFVKPVVRKLNDILYFNTINGGLVELLRYADRNAMAHSREVRLPFLNHELVEFIFALPANFKIHQGWTKWLLRQAMDKHLPAAIAWRKDKTGFEPPQKQWFGDPRIAELLHEQKRRLVQKGVLKKQVLEKRVNAMHAHDPGNADWRYLCAGSFI
ncbi:asparagine synthase (glutamine-hydrolyzing) [Segetibacter sp. 3557_3]|uniref:asparagine synthase (glutamine-hydrolyzing) n=1 Tax=Segetibacter sp. 3557_3 TaxID=2547429 RepID=UPI0010588676|nr:asparagine synthase (glutamine-hydrolyzing) [Segetibacter sp. 3557_3]TDH20901.1 asparagine synthase (glutamine-hydrolyzing) [Segetibacter sp. 3557_3]